MASGSVPSVRSNGVIDLSGLGQITGPGSDDWLDFNIETGGNLLLRTNLATAGRVRSNVRIPDYEIPYLGQASETLFNVTTGATLRLPSLLSLSSGGIPLPAETNSLLHLLAVTTNRVGDYSVVVSNPYGTVTSQVAQLVVDNIGGAQAASRRTSARAPRATTQSRSRIGR